jgi:flavin reductase (DIM6/NTAB) family NADH-FMN oxidoreductase RutF
MSQKSFAKKIPHPVTLLSVSDGQRENVATISWVCAVSRKPPLLMASVSPRRFSHDLILRANEFAIMILSDTQKELSTLAGTLSGSDLNKWELHQFSHLKRKATHINVPVLNNCQTVLECKLVNQVTAGDHTMMIGEVVHMETNQEENPIVLFNHQYFSLGRLVDVYP